MDLPTTSVPKYSKIAVMAPVQIQIPIMGLIPSQIATFWDEKSTMVIMCVGEIRVGPIGLSGDKNESDRINTKIS